MWNRTLLIYWYFNAPVCSNDPVIFLKMKIHLETEVTRSDWLVLLLYWSFLLSACFLTVQYNTVHFSFQFQHHKQFYAYFQYIYSYLCRDRLIDTTWSHLFNLYKNRIVKTTLWGLWRVMCRTISQQLPAGVLTLIWGCQATVKTLNWLIIYKNTTKYLKPLKNWFLNLSVSINIKYSWLNNQKSNILN